MFIMPVTAFAEDSEESSVVAENASSLEIAISDEEESVETPGESREVAPIEEDGADENAADNEETTAAQKKEPAAAQLTATSDSLKTASKADSITSQDDQTSTAQSTTQSSSAKLTTQSSSTQQASIADGIYTIVTSTGGSKCLDVPGGSTSSGVGLQLYSQNATPAQRWSIRALGGELFEILNVGSGKALDVAGAKVANGATIQQYTSNTTAAQKWRIVSAGTNCYKIVSALSDKYVIDVSGGSSSNGAKIQLWTDNGTKAQQWRFVSAQVVSNGFYTVKNSASKKVLDVSGGSLKSGANVQQYTANSTQAQTFYMSYSSKDGYYTIVDLGSGKVLDVAGGSPENGANVQQYTTNGTRAQKWAATKNSDGTITFRSAVSGLALDVSGASSKNGANVQVWAPNGTNAQKWSLSKVSNWLPEGTYSIIATINTGNVIDIAGGSTRSGANVQMYSSNSTNAQRFYLRPIGSGYYTIQNPISGLYLNATGKASGKSIVLGTTQQQFKPVFGAGGIAFRLKENASLVLDISGASTRSGANLQLYGSNGTAAQRFVARLTDPVADGTYSIRYATNTGYAIDVPGASSETGIALQLYESNGTAAQRFRFTRVDSATYRITAVCSGKAIQLVNSGSGTYQLQQRVATNADDQRWIVSLAKDGSIQLVPKSNSKLRVDLSSARVANETPIVAYQSNETAAQKWKLVPSSESVVYDVLSITLKHMAQLQKSNGANSNLTVNELMNLLNPDKLDKAQFLDLRTVTNVTASQLNSYISSTSSGQSGILKGLGSAFVSASKQTGLNEVYLLSHAILESGWGTSELANGYYYNGGYIDGTYYAAGTYYNFYGIGAYDSSPLSGGRKLAIINGWNSPTKAVTGAAQWIAKNYVYASSYAQPTLYAMKWDYARTNSTGERGWHQYATSTSWPNSIASLINQCYARIGGNPNQTYVIPKYQ